MKDTIPAGPPETECPVCSLRQDYLEWMSARMRACGVLEAYGIRLDPHWEPPPVAQEEPKFDPNPEANALAVKAFREKQAARKRVEEQAAADRLTFAHTEGFES